MDGLYMTARPINQHGMHVLNSCRQYMRVGMAKITVNPTVRLNIRQ